MARGRMINRELATSQRFRSLGWAARSTYQTVYAFADRDGRLPGDHDELWAFASQALLCDRQLFSTLAGEIVESGLWVLRESVNAGPYLYIVNFSAHQVGLRHPREAPSRWVPQSDDPQYVAELRSRSGSVPEEFRNGSGPTPPERKGRGGRTANKLAKPTIPTKGEVSAAGGMDAFKRDDDSWKTPVTTRRARKRAKRGG